MHPKTKRENLSKGDLLPLSLKLLEHIRRAVVRSHMVSNSIPYPMVAIPSHSITTIFQHRIRVACMCKLLKLHDTTAYHSSIIWCKMHNSLKRRNDSSSLPRVWSVAIEMLVSPYHRCIHLLVSILDLKREMRWHIKLTNSVSRNIPAAASSSLSGAT